MIDKEVVNYDKGIVDSIEEQSIPIGSASASSNFRTKGDKIELAGGKITLGTILNTQDVCLGVHVGYKRDGTEVLMRKRGKKLEIYNATTDAWDESGSDLFTTAGEFDDAAFVNFDSLAGAQTFISSINSSIFKIMTANPLNPVDMLSTTYRGKIFGSQNRIFLVQRKGTDNAKDFTGVYLSYIDAQNYTTVTAESYGTGNGSAVTFTHTLAFKAGGSKRTCMGISVTDGVESFVDDYNGNLVGSLGGTGTINYATGATSVTFNTAPANLAAITTTYQWEDSTNEGLADFTYSGTRTAGQGDVFRQDSGGGTAQKVCTFKDHEFCFHERKTWDLVLSADDTNATNLPYRDQVGIPNWRAADSSGEGIYYIDDTDSSNPLIRLMSLSDYSTEIIPNPISKKKDMKGYLFDTAWLKVIGDRFVIWGCRSQNADVNDTLFVYDKDWKSIDQFPLYSTCGTIYQGEICLGDSLSPNVYLAFNGFDDDGDMVQGTWESNLWNLTFKDNLKKVKKLIIEGEIQANQIVDVMLSIDRGAYITVGQIRGDGTYVDTSNAVTVGSRMVGKGMAGGGSIQDIIAYHYTKEINLILDKFAEVKWKYEIAIDEDGIEGLGYFSVTKTKFHDVRIKQTKLPSKYRS